MRQQKPQENCNKCKQNNKYQKENTKSKYNPDKQTIQ